MRRVLNSIFIYNLLISYNPLVHPREIKNEATGTITQNLLKKIPQPESMLMKKEVRGTYDQRYENKNKNFIDKLMDCKM